MGGGRVKESEEEEGEGYEGERGVKVDNIEGRGWVGVSRRGLEKGLVSEERAKSEEWMSVAR